MYEMYCISFHNLLIINLNAIVTFNNEVNDIISNFSELNNKLTLIINLIKYKTR